MPNNYRPYFERPRERERREREAEFRRGRSDDFEEWERPYALSPRPEDDRFGRAYRGNYGSYAGRGPKGYQRSDERIREDVCDLLTADPDVDAIGVAVSVSGGEVTLEGTVPDRRMKRDAEDCAETTPGVREVHNRIRVGGAQEAEPASEAHERENLSTVSRFWRGGH